MVDITQITTSPENGGSSITSYNIAWDKASGSTFYELVGETSDSLALTATTSDTLTGGATYLFKYRVKNVHGWSEYSDTVSILAAAIPAIPAAPTTAIENIFVKIAWDLPSGNGQDPTSYKVLIG